jgi:hypothetical protein
VGDAWNHVERRQQPEVCPMHGVMFESIEKKFTDIDETMKEIANRQIEYIKTQARLEYAVSNGMRTDIMVIRERLDTFCDGINKKISDISEDVSDLEGRVVILEAFKWFRDMANKFRETVIWNVLKFALVSGLLVALVYFADKIKKVVLG